MRRRKSSRSKKVIEKLLNAKKKNVITKLQLRSLLNPRMRFASPSRNRILRFFLPSPPLTFSNILSNRASFHGFLRYRSVCNVAVRPFARSTGRLVDKLEFPPARFNFVPENEGGRARNEGVAKGGSTERRRGRKRKREGGREREGRARKRTRSKGNIAPGLGC